MVVLRRLALRRATHFQLQYIGRLVSTSVHLGSRRTGCLWARSAVDIAARRRYAVVNPIIIVCCMAALQGGQGQHGAGSKCAVVMCPNYLKFVLYFMNSSIYNVDNSMYDVDTQHLPR